MSGAELERFLVRANALSQVIDMVYDSDLIPLNYKGHKVNGQWKDYPKDKVKANLLAAGLLADGMGVDPFTGWSNIYPTQAGKLGLAADFKMSLVQAAKHEVEVLERTKDRCRVRARRHGSEKWVEVEVTAEDARRAGWTRNPVYGTDIGMSDMLYHRASGRACDMVGADVLHGLVTIDEIDDVTPPTAVEGSEQMAKLGEATGLRPGDVLRSSIVGKLIEQQHTPTPEVEHVPARPVARSIGDTVEWAAEERRKNQERAARQVLAEAEHDMEYIRQIAKLAPPDEATVTEVEGEPYTPEEVAAALGGEVVEVEEDPGISKATWNSINALFRDHEINGLSARMQVITKVIGRDIARGSEMTTWEGEQVRTYLSGTDTDTVREAAGWTSHEEETQ